MNRLLKVRLALTSLAFVLPSLPAAKADLHFNTGHDSFFAFDTATQTLQVDVYDTVTADAPGDTRSPATVSVLGDPATFGWNGSGSLIVSNVSPGSATLSMPTVLPVGNSHYGYVSNSGQGLFTASTANGVTTVNLFGSPVGLAQNGAVTTLNFVLSGDYVPTSFSLGSGYTVTDNFTYNPDLDLTRFSAEGIFSTTASGLNVSLVSVPEPGTAALFFGLLTGGLGILARRRK